MKESNHVKKRRDWEEWYADARDYYKEHGDLLIAEDYVTDEGEKLGKWLHRQRAKYNGASYMKGTLSDTEIRLLENIGMIWRLEYRFPWNEWLEVATQYRDEHGDLLVPTNYKVGEYALGYWITEKRKMYWKGNLTKSQIQDLDELGMEWAVGFRRDWDDWYRDAKSYYLKYGDLLVPNNYVTDEGFRLGVWISEQRGKCSHREGKRNITAYEVSMLNEIGMVWDISKQYESEWESKFLEVEEFYKENGKLPTTSENVFGIDGKRMDYWIKTQRQYLAEGRYSKDRVKKLSQIGL